MSKGETKRFQHPSFGLLEISRVQGRFDNLVGVDFPVGGAIRITVSHAEQVTDIGREDAFYDREQIVSFFMSEVQFAAAITSLNVGAGTPVTLSRVSTGPLVAVEAPPKHMREFEDRADEAVEPVRRAIEQLNRLNALLADPKAKKSDIKNAAYMAHMELDKNLEYTLKRGMDQVREVGEKTKQEVRAYAESVVHRFGLEALGAARAALPSGMAETPALEDRSDGYDEFRKTGGKFGQ